MNVRSARIILGLGFPITLLAVGLIPYLANHSELPDRVATHFDISGTPDGSMTTNAMLVICLAMWGVGSIVLIALARRQEPMVVALGPSIAAGGAMVAALGAGILAQTSITQVGIATWSDASLSWPWLVAVTGGSFLLAGLALHYGSLLPTVEPVGVGLEVPIMELATGERAVWNQVIYQRWVAALLAGLVAVAAIVASVGVPFSALVGFLIAALASLAFVKVRVQADANGLRVGFGWFRWPGITIPLATIATVSAIDVRPTEWGGWGYRGSLKFMKRAAVVLRSGPGLRLDLTNGKTFVVTVDDPATAAALLRAEMQRQAG